MSLVRAFLSSTLGTGLSRVLGLLRDVAIANVLGAGLISDAFQVAWTFPGALRRFVADEGLTGALLPAVARAEHEAEVEAARLLAGRVLTALLFLGGALVIAGIFAAPLLVDIVAQGFEGEQREIAVQMTRILLPFAIFVSMVSWCEALLNHRQHFFVPKVAPGVVSAAMIAAVLWPTGGSILEAGLALCWGVLVGGALHVLICLPPLYRYWGVVRPRLGLRSDHRFRSVLNEMGKVFVIGIMAQVNILLLRYLASFLYGGAITHYTFATRMIDVAQGIIAVGVGSALLPVISKAAAEEDWNGFRQVFCRAVRLAAVMLFPAAAFLLVLARPTASVLFRHGEFTADDCVRTAEAMQLLVPFMLALAGIQIIKKPFFALERRDALIVVGLFGVFLTGGLGILLTPSMEVNGLALALSCSTMGQFLLYLFLLRRIMKGRLGLRALVAPLGTIVIACIPAALLGLLAGTLGQWSDGPTLLNIALLAGAGLGGGLLYAVAAMALKIEEINQVIDRVRRRIRR